MADWCRHARAAGISAAACSKPPTCSLPLKRDYGSRPFGTPVCRLHLCPPDHTSPIGKPRQSPRSVLKGMRVPPNPSQENTWPVSLLHPSALWAGGSQRVRHIAQASIAGERRPSARSCHGERRCTFSRKGTQGQSPHCRSLRLWGRVCGVP